jgi:hypothetical protein
VRLADAVAGAAVTATAVIMPKRSVLILASDLGYHFAVAYVTCLSYAIHERSGPRALSETDAKVGVHRQVGILPSRAHLDVALDKIKALSPATLACHHGRVKASAVSS